MSNRLFATVFTILVLLSLFSCGSKKRDENPKILVFSKTAGFRHGNIEAATKAVVQLGERKGFHVDHSEDADLFTDDNLKQYAAVLFLNTTGDIFNSSQEVAFERYIQSGGGFLGIHAATDTEYDWKWYGHMVGAYFKSHPKQQEADMIIHPDPAFPLLDSFPNPWVRFDEWYNFRKPPENVSVLVSIDESSYEGGENGENHPMVWYHKYDGGRAFYMEPGHTEESFQEPLYLDLLYAGLEYVMGDNKVLNYDQATSVYPPDENRFSKVRLASAMDEPTEMTILPDHSILISERKGGLQYYNPEKDNLTEVAKLEVYHHTDVEGVNVEMGFMGIKADPDYINNHWVYVYYSPLNGPSVDRLSRFKFENGVWDMSSEQIILDVKTDRDICCHTGGSIAFDSMGNLFVSTGDNSTPFDEKDPETGKKYPINLHGYAPLDDRPGFYNYDGRRAPGNSNDLRGKILRIKVQEDGSYTIPEGNLFGEGNDKARPEIYVMGNRNPYRISVDQKTGYLYWGEVGPDARNDSLDTRGPRGYDELNQARKAGNFGWPYAVGNNYPYWEYDYNTGKSLFQFDPKTPVNNSRHNTGLTELPPLSPAFIYYPYNISEEFPILKSGGRNAMAGPVYYREFFPETTRLPEYFEGKLFIYDWIRNWIMLVKMNDAGDILRIDPFMPHSKFYNLIDMELGPDGTLYFLEYGTGWFSKNSNSGLYKLAYNPGNRPPSAEMKAETLAGPVPFNLRLDASQSSDPDMDPLQYSWYLNDELLKTTEKPILEHTIDEPGVYSVYVDVDDGKGDKAQSGRTTIVTGNSRPLVDIELKGNQQFYFPDKPIRFTVEVNDAEEGSFEDGKLDPTRLSIKSDYMESFDKASTTLGHQEMIDPALEVESIIAGNDCASCHKKDDKSVGPSYTDVAMKYKNDPAADTYLMDKIKKGGSGVWGEVAMAAHPDINENDVKKIVLWIRDLAAEKTEKITHKRSGRIVPEKEFKLTDDGTIILNASYTDGGAPKTKPLTGQKTIYLFQPVLYPYSATEVKGATTGSQDGTEFLRINDLEARANLGTVDLTDVKNIDLVFSPTQEGEGSSMISFHRGSPEGQIIASGMTPARSPAMQPSVLRIKIDRDQQIFQDQIWLVVQRKGDAPPLALVRMDLKP